MATILAGTATEGGTFVVNCTFENEDGGAETPASDVVWRLIDSEGAAVSNGTESAALSVDILLSGSDLVIDDTVRETHWLTLVVSTTYDGALGTGLPLIETCKFQCTNILDTP